MNFNDELLFVGTGNDAPKKDLPFVERDAITAVVYDPKTKRILGLKWKGIGWETLITGGIEEGQEAEDAARVEILEETGYKNLRLIHELPRYHSKFFHHPKSVNRFAHFRCFLFELEDNKQEPISYDEQTKHSPLWLTRDECESFRFPEGQRFILNHACVLIDK